MTGMTEPFRVFVAGPYGDTNPDFVIARNVARATGVALNLMTAGHWVYVAHSMSWGWQHDNRVSEAQYKALDITFLEHWATAIIRIPGQSKGADAEMERARALGLIELNFQHYETSATEPLPCQWCWRGALGLWEWADAGRR